MTQNIPIQPPATAKRLSPDVAEILHMLRALENKPTMQVASPKL